MFNAHIDVVPAGDESLWAHDPWRVTVAGGNAYGRGALDDKGGVVCAMHAARAIARAGIQFRGRLLIASVVGEEDGGTGTLGTILAGHVADAAVVVEPTSLAVVPAQAGALNFRVTVDGIQRTAVSATRASAPSRSSSSCTRRSCGWRQSATSASRTRSSPATRCPYR